MTMWNSPYRLDPRDPRNGDNYFACLYVANGFNRCIGIVRENPRVSHWQAVRQTTRGPKSRYYDTARGAAMWLVRAARKSGLVT